jgi:hypothetical protein
MDKSKFFSISKQVMELAHDFGLHQKNLKTYAAIALIATGAISINMLPSNTNNIFNSSPFKPNIEQSINSNKNNDNIDFGELRNFLGGDGGAMLFNNPFAKNESLTLVHSDKFKTLADLTDPDKWAARIASIENVDVNYPSYTFCKNDIDWDKPIVSLSGKCLTVLNLQQADSMYADVNTKSKLTNDDMRLFVLLHETAHAHSTSRSMTALHKQYETTLYTKGFKEKQADLAAFIAISKTLNKDELNALFHAIIQYKNNTSSYKPSAHDTQGILVIAKKLFNEDPSFFTDTPNEDILFKASLMAKVYSEQENKEVFFPNYQSDSIIAGSMDGIVSRLKSRNNSAAKDMLMNATGLKHYQATNRNSTQLTDLVMTNIDLVIQAVESTRTIQTFDNLINNNVNVLAPHTDTKVFTEKLNQLIGEKLDTPKGYSESLTKISHAISMEQN